LALWMSEPTGWSHQNLWIGHNIQTIQARRRQS